MKVFAGLKVNRNYNVVHTIKRSPSRYFLQKSFGTETQPTNDNQNLLNDKTHQRSFLEEISQKLKYNSMDDWYNIEGTLLRKHGGKNLLSLYDNSASHLVTTVFSEHKWLPWRFRKPPPGFWENRRNHRQFLDWYADKVGYKSYSDFYGINKWSVKQHGGAEMLGYYDNNLAKMVMELIPEYPWIEWKFLSVPKIYWESIENQKKFINWIAKELKIESMDQWYQLRADDYVKNGGRDLMNIYKTPLKLLSTLFPDYPWLPWRFGFVQKGFWENPGNRKLFVEWLYKELNLQSLDDWYKVTEKAFIQNGDRDIAAYFVDSPVEFLKEVYPEKDWLPWKFSIIPKGIWDTVESQRKFLDWMFEEIGLTKMDDWYAVPQEKYVEVNAHGLLSKYSDRQSLLKAVYPEIEWSESKFQEHEDERFLKKLNAGDGVLSKKNQKELEAFKKATTVTRALMMRGMTKTELNIITKSKTQYAMYRYIKNMFPDEDVLFNYLHTELFYQYTARNMELDVYIPSLKIGFEYQGAQHYGYVSSFGNTPVQHVQFKDEQKLVACAEAGITLILVPYWWNLSVSSLQATIYQARPDLFTEKPDGEPIPLEEPLQTAYRRGKSTAAKVAPASIRGLMLATEWNDGDSPVGWWLSEKFDGVRCYWDGENLFSRYGRVMKAPLWFIENLPSGTGLDCELFVERGDFQGVIKLIQFSSGDHWKNAKLKVLDLIDYDLTLKERYEKLKSIDFKDSHIEVVEQKMCESEEEFRNFVANVKQVEGEGVILRKDGSLYEVGLSDNLRFYQDIKEIVVMPVIKNEEGLLCRQLNGLEQFVDCPEDLLKDPPKPGCVISVLYDSVDSEGYLKLNGGKPKFLKRREDVHWTTLRKQTGLI